MNTTTPVAPERRLSAPPLVAALLLTTLVGLAAVPHARAAGSGPTSPLVVLSISDWKGKIGPCGCHVPKGGFARLQAYADSVRGEYANVLLLTTGTLFPDQPGEDDLAAYMLEHLAPLHVQVAGVCERELHFGRGFLLASAKRTGAPLTCANLIDRATGKPMFDPWRIVHSGGVDVGVFALMAPDADLGDAKDSVTIEEPTTACRRALAELRAKGATVIVLLSSLGRGGLEDLVSAVDGIDVAIAGHNVPLLPQGRKVADTMICYGGEQGQYIGRTRVRLDPQGHPTLTDCQTFELGPEAGNDAKLLVDVHAFQDRHSEHLRSLGIKPAPADSTAK